VLVGETERSSGDTSYIKDKVLVKRSATILVGWIVVTLAALFIAWHLYRNNFGVQGSGSQMKVTTFKSTR
jgi:hypothetical protein